MSIKHDYGRLLTFIVLLIVSSSTAIAQELMKVTGLVVDQNAEPLIGVTVKVKGDAKSGTVTGLDGDFSIMVQKGKTLVFSYLGYQTKEVAAITSKLKINMKEDNKMLDDVVVVGYGVQKKSSVTGAISQVKKEDIENRTITNAKAALQGKTAGVQVISSSSAPGSSPTIRIRGYSSNISSDPLYVVDGVRLGDISGLDPNDIASMEVLKDAASAAIYGAEAGNGVVLITTKKGAVGSGRITYDFQYTTESLAKMPKLMNAEEYIQYMKEGKTFTEDYLLKNWDGKTNTSWVDAIYGKGHMQKHNIGFNGGNQNGNYYLSLTYLDNNGMVKGDNDVYRRMTATINAEYQIKPWLKVGTTNQIEKYNVRSVSESNEYGGMLTAVLQMDPLTPVTYAPDNLPAHMAKALADGRHLLTDANGNYYGVSAFYAGEQYNPFIMRDNNVSRNSGFNVNGSIYADFKPFKGFVFTSRLGYRLSGARSSSTSLPFYGNVTQSRDFVDYSAQSNTSIYYQWENFANYMKKFGEHTINAMAGISFQESTYDYVSGQLAANKEDAVKKNNPLFFFLNYASASATKGVAGEKTRSAKYSYFGRLSYDYMNRYYLQASLRADAADLSKLPSTNRWGYFPAVSAGWTISEEKFFAPLRDVVTSLKLRASWGQNGSLAALGGYQYSTDMVQSGIYPLVGGNNYTQVVRPSTLGNDELKWETSEQTNFGIDGLLFKGRMNFSIDYFTKKTKDLLVNGTTPSLVIGGTTSPINAGNVSNKGFEFELGWRDNIGDFSYGIRGNLATLKNEVTYLDPSLTRLQGTTFMNVPLTYFEKGYPVYYFRGYQFTGIDPKTGDPTFADLNDSGDLTDDDKMDLGSAIPNFTYGITLTAAYKGFDLAVFGSGASGNKIFNCINRTDFPMVNKMKELFYDDRWTESNPNGSKPRAGANNMDKYATSSAMVYDGSYFKIKQIQLGYSLPKTLLKKVAISNLRLYMSLDDFFTITKYPGFDPEVSTNDVVGMGIDKGGYPTSRKVVMGFNLEF